MNKYLIILAVTFFSLSSSLVNAQGNREEKTPRQRAEDEVKALVKYLSLTEAQEFYVDSILVDNYEGLKNAADDLQKSGRNDYHIYKQTADLWENKRIEALKKVLDEQQFIKYLKRIGKGKEYKKGKDGKYYLKSKKN